MPRIGSSSSNTCTNTTWIDGKIWSTTSVPRQGWMEGADIKSDDWKPGKGGYRSKYDCK